MTTEEQTAEQSQVITETPNTATGAGAPPPPEAEAPKPDAKLSNRDALAKAFDEAEAASKAEKEAKPDDKTKLEAEKPKAEVKNPAEAKVAEPVKAEAKPDAEQSAAEKPANGQETNERRQSEGQHREPPARFLPEARDKWGPTPHVVKAEIHRVMAEMEQERETTRAAVEAYESVKEYDEMAKSSGTTMKAAMANYVAIDKLLNENPVAGIAHILKTVGITPQQYAEHVMKNPQAAQAPMPQRQQVQQPPNPEIQALKQQVQALTSQSVSAQARPIIEAFAAKNPDYYQLQPHIAKVLKFGIVEELFGTGLSPEQKLAEAYRMVGGRPAPSHDNAVLTSQADSQAPIAPARSVDPDGQKSVRGAPSAGQTTTQRPKFKSNRDALERALSEASR